MALNAAREAIEQAFAARQEELERKELDARLSSEPVDVTLPAALLGPVRARKRLQFALLWVPGAGALCGR